MTIIMLIPVLIRSPKLKTVEPAQCLDSGTLNAVYKKKKKLTISLQIQ